MAKILPTNEMKSDLIALKKLLEKHFQGNLSNVSDLEKAITQLSTSRNGSCCVQDIKLEFKNLNLGKNIRPIFEGEQVQHSMLELRFTKMRCTFRNSSRMNDPIQEYQIQLILTVRDLEKLLAKSAWHFEKHPDRKADGTPENSPEFHHPLYHLHFGGYEMTEDEEVEFGNILVLEAPRIMHPPMDIVLAVDFVLNNFYSCHACQPFINLLKDPEYFRIVEKARDRFLKPFALGLASNFATNHCFAAVNQISVDSRFSKNLVSYSEKH